MNKVFLDQNKPAIDSVIEYLFNQEKYLNKETGSWNLSNVLLVVPSARVRRELLYQLLLFSQERSVLLEIPKIVTIGRAPEFFYRQTRPFADDVTQNLAWFRAIKLSDEKKRIEYLPSIPDDDDLEGQYLLGQMFSKLHQSLSAEMLDFDDEFRKLLLKHRPRQQSAETSNFDNELSKCDRNIVNELVKFQNNHKDHNLKKEIDRWKYFSKIKEKYLSILDENNLWDVQVARRYALAFKQPGDFETNLDVVLAGIVDLNRVQKAILNEVRDHVTALIFAPESDSDGFDDFGALDVKHWSEDLFCPLSDKKIVLVEKPEEQVLCAFEYIRQLSSQYTPEEVTIGAPDDKMIPYVQAAAEKLGLQIDNLIGVPITSTAPYALLLAISDFLDFHSYESFANLVRHPAVFAAVSKNASGTKMDILSALDSFQQEYFPLDVSSVKRKKLKPSLSCTSQQIQMVRDALSWVMEWLSDFLKKELDKDLGQIIATLFNQLPEDKTSFILSVEALIINSCGKLKHISEEFTGKLSPQSALKMVLLRLQSFNLINGSEDIDVPDDELDSLNPLDTSKSMIHLAGWLELVWDRAPVLTILSFNEGVIPQNSNSDLFLPNELRKELGILDNSRRLARDAYSLKAMASSKKHLLVICGKVDTEGKAALPSRLLFHKDKFTQQAYNFFKKREPNDKDSLPKFTLSQEVGEKTLPSDSSRNKVLKWANDNLRGNKFKGVVTEVSATKFKSYLECPFRFYLKYVANVEPTDYAVNELQALSFGSIIHQVLQTWAQEELDSGNYNWHPDAEELSKKLNAIVDQLFEQSYPNSVQPSIVIQKEIIKQRLDAFAGFQRSWPGNTIAIEKPLNEIVQFEDKEEMTLVGRIDRIDLLPNGDIALLDYKTSDSGKNPNEDHLDKNKWINLQLPVYRHLLLANHELFPEFNMDAEIKVGYINISKEKVAKFENPEWTDDVFKTAEDKISEVMENIHNGVFWPPSEDVKYDAYPEYVSWLLQDDESSLTEQSDE